MTTLSDAHKQAIRAWLQQGLQLAEIQKRLAAELGVHLTYMELKLAVSELDVLPQDQETIEPPPLPSPPTGSTATTGRGQPPAPAAPAASASAPPPPAPPPTPGQVKVTVDQLARPGALASGQVQFSDGKKATWYFDEMGRLGLLASEPGYRPPASDIPAFQAALDRELSRMGL